MKRKQRITTFPHTFLTYLFLNVFCGDSFFPMSSAFRGGVQEGLIWRVGARITHWKLTLVCPKALGPALSPPSQRHPVQMHLQSRANQTNFGPQEMESHTALDTISLPLICY